MMGSSRTNEKGKAPAFANPFIKGSDDNAKNIVPSIPTEGHVDGGEFDYLLNDIDMPFSFSGWEDVHQSVAQGISENIGNPGLPFSKPDSYHNPQISMSSNTVNTNLHEAPLLPECNIGWGQQFMSQGHNAISAAGISTFGGQSNFAPFNRPQVNRDIGGSSFVFQPQDIAPVHNRNSVNLNTNHCGVQGKIEGSFLSLGIGGTQEAIAGSRPNNREVSDNLREAASAELKIACARRAMDQTFVQTLDDDFMGFQRNSSGFTNQFSQVDRVASTNNEVGVHCTLNSGPSSSPFHVLQMQHNNMQHGISRHDVSSRNAKYGYLDHYRAFVGNQPVYPGTLGSNSAQFLNSQQHNLNNLAPESPKPSLFASHTPSGQLHNICHRTASNIPLESSMNSPSLGLGSCSTRQNHAGQLVSLNAMPTQNSGGSLLSQRTTAPQVSWVGRGPASSNAQFPKRLGVEYNGRNFPQAAQKHPSLTGTNLQATSIGQICRFPDEGASRLPEHAVQPFVDAGVHLHNDPRVAASTNASTGRPYQTRTAVIPPQPASQWVQRQRTMRPTIHYSMPNTSPAIRAIPAHSMQNTSTALRAIPAHSMQNTSPAIRAIPAHSMQNTSPAMRAIPVTTALHQRAIPVVPQTQPSRPVALPVAAHIRPSIPHPSHLRPRMPVATASNVYHISRKDPDAIPKLTGYKCFLCKRDLALSSEGAMYQPTVPPPVAVLPCGHTFHDQCLENITPQDQAKEPPCIPCAIGEN